MQVCTLLKTDNHASIISLSFLQAGCPSCRPTNSVKALKVSHKGQRAINLFISSTLHHHLIIHTDQQHLRRSLLGDLTPSAVTSGVAIQVA